MTIKVDDLITPPSHSDYEQINRYIQINGADFQTFSKADAQSYIEKLRSSGEILGR